MEGATALPYIVLSMTIVFLFFMQGFVAPCLWLLLAEIFPLQLRALGGGICVFCLWIVDACVGAAFPVILDQFGLGAAFFVFVFALIITFIFASKCIPETKGKSLEEIEHYFHSLDKSGAAA